MILTVATHAPCKVFDANGVELLYAIWADTETGEAVHYVKEDGHFVQTTDDSGRPCMKTVWRQHAAPLRYESGCT